MLLNVCVMWLYAGSLITALFLLKSEKMFSEELRAFLVTLLSKPFPLLCRRKSECFLLYREGCNGFCNIKGTNTHPSLPFSTPNEQARNLVWNLIRAASRRVNCMVPFTRCPASNPLPPPNRRAPSQNNAVLVTATKTVYS
jgi:hypothetical protein